MTAVSSMGEGMLQAAHENKLYCYRIIVDACKNVIRYMKANNGYMLIHYIRQAYTECP